MPQFTVKYYAGTYSGTRTVNADDEDHAIAKVKSMIRKDMSLSMYSDSYKIVDSEYQEDDNEEY